MRYLVTTSTAYIVEEADREALMTEIHDHDFEGTWSEAEVIRAETCTSHRPVPDIKGADPLPFYVLDAWVDSQAL